MLSSPDRDDARPSIWPPRDIVPVAPVSWSPSAQVWIVSRYAEAMQVLRSPDVVPLDVAGRIEELARRSGRDFSTVTRLVRSVPPMMRAPHHQPVRDWLRRLHVALDTRMTEGLVRSAAVEAVEAFGPVGGDVIAGVVDRVPARVIGRVLGLSPATTELLQQRRFDVLKACTPSLGLADSVELEDAAVALRQRVFEDLLRVRGTAAAIPGLFPVPDDGALSIDIDQAADYLVFFALSATETLTSLIGSALFAAHAVAGTADDLLGRPGRQKRFIEEVLRYAPPLRRLTARRALSPLVLGSSTLPSGAIALVEVEAAHRDPEAYDDPDAFRPDRPAQPTLAFGGGVHTCLGAKLARFEGRIVLEAVLERGPWRMVGPAPVWLDHPVTLRLDRLMLRPARAGRGGPVTQA